MEATQKTEAEQAVRRERQTVMRCECLRCGVHFRVEAGLVVLGGNCPNCGSYERQPLCIEPRGPFNPWTWRTNQRPSTAPGGTAAG